MSDTNSIIGVSWFEGSRVSCKLDCSVYKSCSYFYDNQSLNNNIQNLPSNSWQPTKKKYKILPMSIINIQLKTRRKILIKFKIKKGLDLPTMFSSSNKHLWSIKPQIKIQLHFIIMSPILWQDPASNVQAISVLPFFTDWGTYHGLVP